MTKEKREGPTKKAFKAASRILALRAPDRMSMNGIGDGSSVIGRKLAGLRIGKKQSAPERLFRTELTTDPPRIAGVVEQSP
ncbi:MAG: hypothetical protein LBI87_04520 [Candidatus Accumulibacter sp.]|jgi:hypothetical protein|nr:hypothetical protein [Accumulibacter sp.]